MTASPRMMAKSGAFFGLPTEGSGSKVYVDFFRKVVPSFPGAEADNIIFKSSCSGAVFGSI